ncbi:hypothetical protein HHL22_12880 [Hymenobacter sp. RP-2-7]|uniref:Glycosyl-4,4'-diaponeurosporenoate acyltransferase n=1 Tax=Hymenobacter polaris TaxID=2682546 RepID=A0A7Y0AEV1_9BACT|nr:hypothetical protein [Hymenobacter polaris]NML66101.1 hypothetical protein [Hymenobacter polaris]
MPTAEPHRATPSPAVLAFYNAVPNVLWSVLSLVPMVVFCYQHVARPWLYGFVALSLLAYAWPTAWLRHLQLSTRPAVYRKLRVPVLNHFTQHGTFVNRLLRRRYPQYQYLPLRANLAKVVRTTYHLEQFHWVMLVYFLLTTGYAVALGYWSWVGVLTLLNVGYNLYPIWLQQYLRLRLRRLPRLG